MVAVSINPEDERNRKALQGVGEAHSTHDVKDSITFKEGRRLTVCRLVLKRGGLYSSIETHGGRRI